MKWDKIFLFIVGLALGFGGGYMVSDYQFRKVEKHMASSTQSPNNPHAGNAMDQITQQIEMLKSALEKDPENVQALIGLGNLYYDANMFDQAIPYYEKAYSLKKDDANLITDLGTCYRETGNPQKAVEFYDLAVKVDPSHWQALYNAVIVYIHDIKDKEKAKVYFERLKKVAPSDMDFSGIAQALSS